MPFNTALDTTRYNALRGNGSPRTYKASQFLCISSNAVVLKSTVAATPTDASYASITFGATLSGNSANVEAGMSVFAGLVDDIRQATFEGRARGAVSGSSLPVNETSAVITSGMYLWIIKDFRPFHELGRVSGGVYYKDYSSTFIQLRPVIYNLQSAYAGIVSGSPAGYTVSFAAQAIAATSGATISSYAYTIPSGGTVTAGATNTANVTVRFDASPTEYWVKLIVTDSGGRTQTRWIPVWAVPANLSTTVVRGFTGARIEGSIDSGWTATVDAFAGIESMMDGTLCCIFSVEYYQETAYSLFSNVDFVGRFRKENNASTSDETYSTKRKVAFEIEGTAAQLARISSPEITARDASTPTVWDEIKTLTIWRAITYLLEHSTFHQSFSLTFDSTDNSYRAYQLEVSGQNQYEGVKDLASSINAVFEFSPTGEARVVRDARYLGTSARDALVTVANLTASDWTNISDLEREYNDTVGLVEASGGIYSPTGGGISSTAVQTLLSIAPGVAQGNGDGTDNLSKQILLSDVDRATAQTELNTRAANHFVLKNGTASLNVDMRGAYHWIVPSANQWWTWTIDTTDNQRGLEFTSDDRWLLRTVSIEHDNTRGNKTVSATFLLESNATEAGVAGQPVLIPPQNVTPPILPSLPPFFGYPSLPPLPDVYLPPNPGIADMPPVLLPGLTNGVPLDGNAVAIFTDDHVWVTQKFITTPNWIDITPDNLLGTVRDIRKIGYGLYVLSSDSINSAIYYRANVFGIGAWTDGQQVTGVYTQITPTSTEGSLYLMGTLTGGGTTTLIAALGATESNYNTGISITSGDSISITASGTWCYSGVAGCTDANGEANFNPASQMPSENLGTLIGKIGAGGTWFKVGTSYSGTASATGTLYLADNDSAHLDNTGTLAVTVNINGGGTTAFQSVYSTNYGTTFAAARVIATSGAGADTVKIGAVVLAAGATQVRKATSGGAYADYGSALPASFVPIALLSPRFQFGSTTSSNSSTNPQYLIASSAVDGSGNTLYKVTATGATFTDITPSVSGDTFLGLGNYCITMPWWSGSRIAIIGMFGSLPRLLTSTNAGSSFSDRGVLTADACAIWMRGADRTMKQLFGCDGQPFYSPNFGASLYYKSYPASKVDEPVRGLQVWG